MSKRLQDMTLEELWELFPIEIVDYNPAWPEWAKDEMSLLDRLLRDFSPQINHIGSTAIPGIKAKPTIDILIELSLSENTCEIINIMEDAGYILMNETDHRLSFNKGYTPQGYADKVYHIHFHERGDNKEVVFRDYLRANPRCAAAYEKLKLSLLPQHTHNRDGYTEAKSPVIPHKRS
ncbi:MAG: GrpB family protein [Muribaculaceae bacterium]|nr:GrpB family protein [Muribaculaceae bacterium]